MKNDNVKKYLEEIKKSGKFDAEYSDIFIKAVSDDTDGESVARVLNESIEKRYEQNQKNNP